MNPAERLTRRLLKPITKPIWDGIELMVGQHNATAQIVNLHRDLIVTQHADIKALRKRVRELERAMTRVLRDEVER